MANAMAEPLDVVDLFVNVVDTGVPHCRICYRTSKEVALVRPNKLLEFTSAFKSQGLFGSSALDKSACMICESTAATAVRLRDAMANACSIKAVMETFKQNLATKKFHERHLDSNVRSCNKQLNSYRERTTFKQTEVLVIDSLGLEWSNKSTGKNPTRVELSAGARVDPPIETVVLDDDDEVTKTSQVISQKPHQITNLNIQPSMTPKKIVPINDLIEKIVDKSNYAALIPNKLQIIIGHESLSEHFILHDIVVAKDGSLTVPGISSEIKGGELVYNPQLLTKTPTFLIQPSNLNAPAKNYVQNAINNKMSTSNHSAVVQDKNKNLLNSQKNSNDLLRVKDTNKTINRDKIGRFLGTLTRSLNNSDSNKNGESSNMNIVNVQSETETSEKSTDTIEFVEIDNILRKTLENNKRSAKTKKSIDLTETSVDLTETSVDLLKKPRMELKVDMKKNNSCLESDVRPLAVISSVTSQAMQVEAETSIEETEQHFVENVPKMAIEKRGNIDWENKIPMDVISFIDATDPNAGDLIVPDPVPKEPEEIFIKDEDIEDYVIEIS